MSYQYTPKDISRFNSYVKIIPSGCHEWQAFLSKGYGMFWANRRMMYAHRVAWEMANGPIPPGMCILHRCDNPRCCNPEHLWIGTKKDNRLDCVAKGRDNRTLRSRGEDRPNAKLTERDVVEIRETYAGGECTHEQLAVAFRVNQALIGRIVRRESWVHVA